MHLQRFLEHVLLFFFSPLGSFCFLFGLGSQLDITVRLWGPGPITFVPILLLFIAIRFGEVPALSSPAPRTNLLSSLAIAPCTTASIS
jgi:hypothetical protein